MNIVATICARGGSKGLPGKNIRPFAGVPLIAHTIRQALACRAIAGVYVSTDDEAIAAVARAEGAQVPGLRPAALATDESSKLPAIEHLVRQVEAAGMRVGTIVDLQPTSPLRSAGDIDGALALRGEAELVVGVTTPSHNPYYTLVESAPDGVLSLSKPAGFVRRQDAPAVWGLNGAIYVWQRDALQRAIAGGFWSLRMKGYPMPRSRSVDIDDLEDFEMAEWLWTRRSAEAGR